MDSGLFATTTDKGNYLSYVKKVVYIYLTCE